MKNHRFLLLVSLLVLSAAGFWWVQKQTGSKGTDNGLIAHEEPALSPSKSDPVPAKLETLKPTENSDEATRQRVKVQKEPELSAEQLAHAPITAKDQAIWIEGLVVLPENMPTDNAIEVEARGKRFPGKSDRRSHRVPISADGRFRVAVSPDSTVASLLVFGQYLYMEDPYVWKPGQTDPVQLEPQLGGGFEFQVILPPGSSAPLKDWTANLFASQGYVWPRTFELDKDLRFRLPGMGSTMWGQLNIQVDGYASYQRQFYNNPVGLMEQVSIELVREARVRGTVRDEQGQPISAGRVHAYAVVPGREDYISREEGEPLVDGTFLVKGLAAGDYSVRFDGFGYLCEPIVVKNLTAGETREVALVVTSGKQIAGTVLWSNHEPAVGVEVKLVRPKPEFGAPETAQNDFLATTDEVGAFKLSGFSDPGPFGLVASGIPPWIERPADLSKLKARRWERENTVQALADNVLPGGPPVSLVLGEQGGQIAGQVVDERGKPVTSFRINAAPRLGKSEELGSTGARKERIDHPDGKFLLEGVPDGTWVVQASASGHMDMDPVLVEVPSQKDLVLTLPRGGEILGYVVDSAGKPVKAEVSINMEEVASHQHSVGIVNESQFNQSKFGKGFRFAGLAAGRWTLTASVDGYADVPPVTITLSLGEVREGVTIPLPPSGSIVGTVDRSWLEGEVYVELMYKKQDSSEGEYWHYVPSANVDSEGRFRVSSLQVGTYRATLGREQPTTSRASNPSPGSFFLSSSNRTLTLGQAQEVTVRAGQESRVTFAGPAHDSIVLSGRLLEGTAPAAGWVIRFSGTQPSRTDIETSSSKNGAYRIVLEGAGTYQVEMVAPVDSESTITQTVEIQGQGAQTMDLVLPTSEIILELQLPQGQTVAPYNYVGNYQLRSEKDGKLRAASEFTGHRIHFKNMEAGTYTLAPSRVSSQDGEYLVRSQEPIVLPAGESSLKIPIRCTLGGTVVGTLTGDAPSSGLAIYVFTSPEGHQNLNSGWVQDGTFRIPALPPGDVWLSTTWKVAPDLPRTLVHLEEGRETTVQLPYYPQ